QPAGCISSARRAADPGPRGRVAGHLDQPVAASVRRRSARFRVPAARRRRVAPAPRPAVPAVLPRVGRPADRDVRLGAGGRVSPLVVREPAAADASGIRRLFERVFGREMTPEEWSWKVERNPDGWFGVIAVLDGNVVGNYAGWGVRFVFDGREELVYAVGDVATDPAVRTLGRSSVFRRMTD